MKHKRWFIYMLRWQLSTPVLAPIMHWISGQPTCWMGAIVANLVGGEIFYFVDKWIFKNN